MIPPPSYVDKNNLKPAVNPGDYCSCLEKTKHEDSEAKWKEFDAKYHFSCQFTADMIAMNTADFTITSTFQEIPGRTLPIILSMARLDTVKNITGLTEWFGKNTELRNLVNLVVVAGFFDPSKSSDRERNRGDQEDACLD
ncbi:hypothetical protein OIU76_000907 [Salix suchowensis]|nr:hypothetical protein OIU76_000907 [Salix suchowensis]